jgi:hypothetical protein
VGVSSGTFTKADTDDGDSGTIYGSDATLDADKNIVGTISNPVLNMGHAAYVYDASSPKWRDKTAGSDVPLNSGDPANWGY